MIIILIFSGIGITYATTSSELQKQQKEIEDQIAQTNSEIAGVKKNMTEALTQINALNAEISNYEDEISDLESKINSLTEQITQKQADIEEQEEKYAIQKDLLDKRLIALYEAGSSSYLDLLLSADGLSDFISKYYIISTIAESDQELLTRINDTKNKIEEEKTSLETYKEEIATSKTAVEGKKNSLASSRSSKQAIVSTLSDTEKELQEQLEEFEQHKKEIQSEIAKQAAKYTGTPVAPSAAGYISPLAGKTKNNITTGYLGYAGHTGVDFACSSGTPVLAVKSGTVYKSTAKMSNGKYVSYGEYIIIDHGDGTMTLYAHMLAGSRLVSPGDTVSQGQQIGSVGSTGNSTGPHLHFEVFSGGKRVNPTSYLP
jgi:murein DD-endopeptidase MepM/ murein hydrolase activator NlpD